MRPSVGIQRGSSRERYMTEPMSSALRTAMRPGPSRNVQSWMATRAWPVVTQGAGVGAGGAGDVLAERVRGHDGDDADEDQGGFEDPGRDEAERGTVAVAPGDRVEGDGGDRRRLRAVSTSNSAPNGTPESLPAPSTQSGLSSTSVHSPNLTGIEKTKVAM